MKIRSTRSTNDEQVPKKDHWIEYSEDKYGKELVADTRLVLQVLVLYLPITLFWALFYQQGSRWVLQAVRMDGYLGFYTIIPDQFNVLNPLLALLLIPLFEKVLDPLLAKVNISGDLHKITLGGVLAGVAFLVSAVIELQLQNEEYMHMTWLLPQYTLMVTLPLMNFSYTVSPKSMKTTIQAFSNLAIGMGNLIVVIVVGSRLLESQVYEFVLFAGLIFADMILFAFLSKRFNRVKLME